MSEQLTRQQLYDRIRETSKDEYILEEMKRLGFWETKTDKPSLSEEVIKREGALRKELNQLLEKQRNYNNQDALLREMRKERMKLSKEKQAETKLRNEEKRREKTEKWEESKRTDIIYLGENVSKGLQQKTSDLETLKKHKLPHFESLTDLSNAIEIPLSKLRFLAFNRSVSKTLHYHNYYVPKKSGGKRLISAPKPLLKQAQNWILQEILYKIQAPDNVHGFVKERSILTNAIPHVNQEIVINLDLKDFFPSISYKRVKGLFLKLGYSEQLSILFALLCTHNEVDKLNVDGQTYFAQKGERFLPQGSPASPAITTLIAYKMDKRLQGLAEKFGFVYTRYADDLTFSTSQKNEKNVSALLYFVKKVVEDEDFTIHPKKTHVMRKGTQQKVTGIIVNEKPSIDRKILRKFRAFLHHVSQTGWEQNSWGNAENSRDSAVAFASFVKMVNAEKGQKFIDQINKIPHKPIAPKKAEKSESVEISEPKELDIKVIKPSENQSNNEGNSSDWWDIF